MVRTISFVNSKGGAGKTTLASTLAVFLQKTGERVLLIDTDPEGSMMQWYSRRENKDGIGCMASPLAKLQVRIKAEAASGEWEWIVVDTPGRLEEIRPALDVDLVVIPVQSGGHDLIRFTRAYAVCRSVGAKVLLVPNRVKTGTRSEGMIAVTLSIMTRGTATVTKTLIHDRAVHGTGSLEGLSILDFEPKTSAGSAEMITLFNEMRNLIDGPKASAEVG